MVIQQARGVSGSQTWKPRGGIKEQAETQGGRQEFPCGKSCQGLEEKLLKRRCGLLEGVETLAQCWCISLGAELRAI